VGVLGEDFCWSFPFLAPLFLFTVSTLYIIWFAFSTIILNIKKYNILIAHRNKFDERYGNKPAVDYNQMCLFLLLEYQWNCEERRIHSVAPEDFKPQMSQAISGDSDWNDCYVNAYIYPTISDSIADGNDIYRRIFNILTTACAYILLMFVYFDYIDSSPERQARDFVWYYLMSTIGLVTLVFVPLFPNEAIRMQKYLIMKVDDLQPIRKDPVEVGKIEWRRISEKLHLSGITITVITMVIAIWSSQNVTPLLVKILFTIFSIFVALFLTVNILINFFRGDSNKNALYCVFLHVTETGLLLFMILSFLFTAWSRNHAVWGCLASNWSRFLVPALIGLVTIFIINYFAFIKPKNK